MKRLLNMFRRKPAQPTFSMNPSAAPSMRLEDWRRQPQLVEDARKLFASPTWKLLSEVLRNESPVNYQPVNEGVNANSDLQTLGSIRGYHKALNNLEAFAQSSDESQLPEPTFEVEKPETQT